MRYLVILVAWLMACGSNNRQGFVYQQDSKSVSPRLDGGVVHEDAQPEQDLDELKPDILSLDKGVPVSDSGVDSMLPDSLMADTSLSSDSKVLPDTFVRTDSGVKTDSQTSDMLSGADSGASSDLVVLPAETVAVKAISFAENIAEDQSESAWVVSNGLLLASSNGGVVGSGVNRVVFNITFKKTGDYYLFFEGRYGTAGEGFGDSSGANDSFFVSKVFGENPPTYTLNGWCDHYWSKDGQGFLSATLRWYGTDLKLSVSDSSKKYQLYVGTREDGMILSRIAFSTDSDWHEKLLLSP